MNQSLFQRRVILDGLRERSKMATAEFYAKVGIDEPARPVRFVVEGRGNNMFEVRERTTGKVHGFKAGHRDGCQLAQRLEDEADATEARRSSMRNFARNMLGWTVTFCVVLVALAISAHR
ncbi:hypothetical protein QN386_02025 [Pseudomonas sp. CCI3.2]|uniref:hypothetical protein n=1 Tax=unclassified Pseudomonas TaxID=196821 RepID=UPI002AC90E1F|nr:MULTISPECIES: hypothetical protein [unclassified Pseudomonas]MEB0076093.1 hypothetical protein [Pseudomonas sp. MH10out]MEB0090801.1 hypothetical protein [Pseudomonas sp. CCI4.2]MEB0100107.1 hypothetical protein [Pseudomonas sp. CCI3.2]MEB0132048.1 hypothetical protein [Pseudomonas sp. CCI2.4]MEB0156154.1 hypothetical protein [Pseudomonas sp. AH2 (2023)]